MIHKTISILALTLALTGCGTPSTNVTVHMTDFAYTPNTIVVPVGQPIRLTMENEGAIEHDFVVEQIDVKDVSAADDSMGAHHGHDDMPEYDLHVSTGAGQANVLEFTALKPGTYRIFCSIEGHIEAGMLAELIVTE
jgi:uncharacterized cupredoxin-like copper-binding protein